MKLRPARLQLPVFLRDLYFLIFTRQQQGKIMADIDSADSKVSRREVFDFGSAALAAATWAAAAKGADDAPQQQQPDTHNAPNESDPGPQNRPLAAENPDSEWSPSTDSGTVKPFKYSFSLARKRVLSGGWTRQVSVRELPISTAMAGVEMRLTAGGVRELHWHVEAEWAIMLNGNARITAVDQNGKSFVSDVGVGDLWLFPPGVPHSIQGLGPDGCRFLLVFDDGAFDEFHTFLITDWLAHTPKEVLAKNFNVSESTFDAVPKKDSSSFKQLFRASCRRSRPRRRKGPGRCPSVSTSRRAP